MESGGRGGTRWTGDRPFSEAKGTGGIRWAPPAEIRNQQVYEAADDLLLAPR
jgi:hypothetical protein